MFKQILITLAVFACAVHAKVTVDDIRAANQILKDAIDQENQCTSAADCAVVAIGARACGGPGSYAVYSTKSSNVELIRSAALKTMKLEQQYNMENSVISICSIVRAPGVNCDQTNKCVAVPTSSSFSGSSLF